MIKSCVLCMFAYSGCICMHVYRFLSACICLCVCVWAASLAQPTYKTGLGSGNNSAQLFLVDNHLVGCTREHIANPPVLYFTYIGNWLILRGRWGEPGFCVPPFAVYVRTGVLSTTFAWLDPCVVCRRDVCIVHIFFGAKRFLLVLVCGDPRKIFCWKRAFTWSRISLLSSSLVSPIDLRLV